jgi:hypothetical protein
MIPIGTPYYRLLAASSQSGALLLRGGIVAPFMWSQPVLEKLISLSLTPEAEIMRRLIQPTTGDWLLLEGIVTSTSFRLPSVRNNEPEVEVTFRRIVAYLLPGDRGDHTNEELLAEYRRLTKEPTCSP